MRNRNSSVQAMAAANFDSWLHSPRTIIMGIAVMLLCLLEVLRQNEALSSTGFTFNLSENIYLLFSGNLSIVMASALFFVMISELPRRIGFQNNLLIRSTQKRWLMSQVLYSVWMVLAMLALIFICLLTFSLINVSLDGGWSDDARIASGEINQYQAIIPQAIRDTLSPESALLYAILPVFFFWFSMTMIILLCSLLGSSTVGLLICAFAFLSGYISSYGFSLPIEFAVSETINPQFMQIERYWNVLLGYAILNAFLLISMWLRIAKIDLVFSNENRF